MPSNEELPGFDDEEVKTAIELVLLHTEAGCICSLLRDLMRLYEEAPDGDWRSEIREVQISTFAVLHRFAPAQLEAGFALYQELRADA